jgi:hypothetical protein
MTRRIAALTLGLFLLSVAPALAQPPAGDWTYLRKDRFKHYACKEKGSAKGKWRIRTSTFINGNEDAIGYGIGAYAALARGGNKKLAAQRDSANWRDGYIFMSMRGAESGDRLWVQGAYYGPAEPWSDGRSVRRITRCA